MAHGNAGDPLAALQDLATDIDLDAGEIAAAVEQAVASTYRRLIADDPEVRARVDPATTGHALTQAFKPCDRFRCSWGQGSSLTEGFEPWHVCVDQVLRQGLESE